MSRNIKKLVFVGSLFTACALLGFEEKKADATDYKQLRYQPEPLSPKSFQTTEKELEIFGDQIDRVKYQKWAKLHPEESDCRLANFLEQVFQPHFAQAAGEEKGMQERHERARSEANRRARLSMVPLAITNLATMAGFVALVCTLSKDMCQ